jgi:hypothetical protein
MELGKKEKQERQQPDLEETDEVAVEVPSKEFSSSDSTSSSGSSDDDDMIIGSIREVSYHPTIFKVYAAPRQRQEWGQTQILPRVNWGDLFFGTCPLPIHVKGPVVRTLMVFHLIVPPYLV